MSQSYGFHSFFLYLFKLQCVRKRIRIKTFLLLLAWLVIFAHSTIPHRHSDDNCIQTADCSPSQASSGNELLMSVMFTDQPAEVTICHLSNILFQNLNPENFQLAGASETIIIPVFITGKIYISSTISLISPQSCSTVGFRAPPFA